MLNFKRNKTNNEMEGVSLKDIFDDELKVEIAFESSWKVFRVIRMYILFIVFLILVQPMFAPSNSMYPTIKVNDYMFFRLSNNNIQRGDIVSFTNPYDESEIYVKRVIGLPGDSLEIINGIVYINTLPLDEEYIYTEDLKYYHNESEVPVNIPINSYFVIGDNRYNSIDSRDFGVIKKETVKGKLLFNIPLSKLIKERPAKY